MENVLYGGKLENFSNVGAGWLKKLHPGNNRVGFRTIGKIDKRLILCLEIV